MDRYLEQLLEDMRSAAELHRRHTLERALFASETDDQAARYAQIDAYVGGVSEGSLYEVLGFIPEQFPPADQLTRRQAEGLAEGMLSLLETYRTLVDAPEGVPPYLLYPQLLRLLHGAYFDPGPGGYLHLECCEYDPSHCPWPEHYCRCRTGLPGA